MLPLSGFFFFSQRSLSSSSSAPQRTLSLSRSPSPSIFFPNSLPPLFLQLSRRGYLGLRIHKTRLRCVCFCYFSQNGAPTATLLATDPCSAADGQKEGRRRWKRGRRRWRGFGGGPAIPSCSCHLAGRIFLGYMFNPPIHPLTLIHININSRDSAQEIPRL